VRAGITSYKYCSGDEGWFESMHAACLVRAASTATHATPATTAEAVAANQAEELSNTCKYKPGERQRVRRTKSQMMAAMIASMPPAIAEMMEPYKLSQFTEYGDASRPRTMMCVRKEVERRTGRRWWLCGEGGVRHWLRLYRERLT
jgi:hypothetical protein